MTISNLPAAPARSDAPADFISKADAWVAALPTFVTEANATANAMNLNSTNDTSASSVLIGTGSKTFTVSASKSFLGGMFLVIADTAAPSTNWMFGQVTSYAGTTLTVNVTAVGGSGTKTAWTISQSAAGIAGQQVVAGLGANTFTGLQTYAVGANIATAATVDLTAATGNLVHLTGSTGITAFTMNSGQMVEVIFDAAPLLTHHATNLNLPKGANIQAQAGDRATLWRDGTTVYCTKYERASNRHTIWVPAGAMIPRTTNGAASGSVELTTSGDIMLKTLDYDTATEEGAQFTIAMPKSWNLGTVIAQFFWTAASGSGTAAFGLRGVAMSNDDPIDTTEMGTGQISTDTLILANDLHVSPETASITIGGTPAVDDLVWFEVYRDVATDTLGVDARLIGVKIIYTANSDSDA
jgi:hypothetical protein